MRITHGTGDGSLTPGRVELIIWSMAFTTFAYVSLSVSLSPLLTAIADDFGVSESAVGQLATISGIVATISALASAPWMGSSMVAVARSVAVLTPARRRLSDDMKLLWFAVVSRGGAATLTRAPVRCPRKRPGCSEDRQPNP